MIVAGFSTWNHASRERHDICVRGNALRAATVVIMEATVEELRNASVYARSAESRVRHRELLAKMNIIANDPTITDSLVQVDC